MKRLGPCAFLSLTAMLFLVVLVAGCGDDGAGPGNRAPSTTSLSAAPDTVDPSGLSTITCVATDPDGDALSYAWDCEGGTLSGSGAAVTWTAPLAAGAYEITVVVDDGQGHSASDTTEVEVRAGTLLVSSDEGVMAVDMNGSSGVFCALGGQVDVLGTRIFVGQMVREVDHTGTTTGLSLRPPEVTRVTGFKMLPDGGVAIAENSTDSVFFVSPTGELLDAVQMPDASPTNQGIAGVVVGNDLIISETGSRKLAGIDLTTHEVSVFKMLSPSWTWLGGIDYADGLYYLTLWQSLYEFTETGDPTEIAHFPDGGIQDVAVVGTSAFVVSNTQGKVYRVDLPTGEVEVFAEGFEDSDAIAYLPVGPVPLK
jgi:hypothetical protein